MGKQVPRWPKQNRFVVYLKIKDQIRLTLASQNVLTFIILLWWAWWWLLRARRRGSNVWQPNVNRRIRKLFGGIPLSTVNILQISPKINNIAFYHALHNKFTKHDWWKDITYHFSRKHTMMHFSLRSIFWARTSGPKIWLNQESRVLATT